MRKCTAASEVEDWKGRKPRDFLSPFHEEVVSSEVINSNLFLNEDSTFNVFMQCFQKVLKSLKFDNFFLRPWKVLDFGPKS